jgi:hypothetical protein
MEGAQRHDLTSRGAASLAAARSQAALARPGEPGSMSRPELVGVIFEDKNDIGVVEFVARQDAERSIDLEQCDRDHQGTCELECV